MKKAILLLLIILPVFGKAQSVDGFYYLQNTESLNTAVENAESTDVIIIDRDVSLTGDLTMNNDILVTEGNTISGSHDLTFNGRIIAGTYRIFEDNVILKGEPKDNIVWLNCNERR